MPAALHPYLSFPGTSREAFEFYGQALGATPQFLTFGEAGAVPVDDTGDDKSMHGRPEHADRIRLNVPGVKDHIRTEGFDHDTHVTLSPMTAPATLPRPAPAQPPE